MSDKCNCAHCHNHPDYVRRKNEEYKKAYEEANQQVEKDRPESLKDMTLEEIENFLKRNCNKSWMKLTDEEKSWLKRKLAVMLLANLHYVGQLPPCTLELPKFVDYDFTMLYQHRDGSAKKE